MIVYIYIGQYYSDCRIEKIEIHEKHSDQESMTRLWSVSEELVNNNGKQ